MQNIQKLPILNSQ